MNESDERWAELSANLYMLMAQLERLSILVARESAMKAIEEAERKRLKVLRN